MPSKRKKNEVRRAKKEGRRESEKEKSVMSLVNPKNLNILLSAHVRTSQANTLHLDQKAAKCTSNVTFK